MVATPCVDGFRADPDVALSSSDRADRKDRAETRDNLVNLDKLANCKGPVNRGYPLSDLTEEVANDSVLDRVGFAVRPLLIERGGFLDLDRLLVYVVAESANGTPEGRWRVPEAR